MLAEKLLERLDGVKQTGEGSWRARCPAHGSKGLTLAIREDTDRVLLHCFAGCPVDHIVGAAGLELTDLFPPRDTTRHGHGRRPYFPARDVLACLNTEISFLHRFACELARGHALSDDDYERMLICSQRFASAQELSR